ncbi:hypothetical protein FIU88_08000 [Halomonas sp. THAF12]|uniref:hypothetical protein n=1 Tax=Halomonas TaxID=2745 RepID=UPI0002EEA773|nr:MULTISPECIES: hypothetical protein [Halomonas]QFT84915.1 hypothetical protein FIU88_08000 [Halomonas sp. THAF12]
MPADARVSPVSSRLKLLALFAVFLLPMAVAWGMVEWRLGIPEGRTAHGQLTPDLPPLEAWPLDGMARQGADDWVLAFDCPASCDAQADRWWRLHRALGRDAHRISRLRLGGSGETLPGASAASWTEAASWRSPGRLWVFDPDGRAVLAYAPDIETARVLEDVELLLERNPEPPMARLQPE